MRKTDKQIIMLSKDVMNKDFIQAKSIYCTMVLRLMDTEQYSENYSKSLALVLELFPEVDREKLEKELDKYI